MYGVQWNPGEAIGSPGLNEGVETDLKSLQRESDHEQCLKGTCPYIFPTARTPLEQKN